MPKLRVADCDCECEWFWQGDERIFNSFPQQALASQVILVGLQKMHLPLTALLGYPRQNARTSQNPKHVQTSVTWDLFLVLFEYLPQDGFPFWRREPFVT